MRYKKNLSCWKRDLLQKKSNLISFLYNLKQVSQFGIVNSYKLIKNNLSVHDFDHQFGIVTIIKNEGMYIKEWIEFHKLIGVDIIYVYDNESTDSTRKVLDPYIQSGLVKYVFFPGSNKQIPAYQHAIETYRNEVKWLAILDADEFLVPIDDIKIVDAIQKIDGNFSQLLIGWLVYGSNGHTTKPDGLVIENYKFHASFEFIADYKPIINPRLAMKMTFPHWVEVIGKTVDENGKRIWGYPYITQKQVIPASKNKIRINHYYSKSLEEFHNKSKRGYADYMGSERAARDIENFIEHDQNRITDDTMDRFINQLHQVME